MQDLTKKIIHVVHQESGRKLAFSFDLPHLQGLVPEHVLDVLKGLPNEGTLHDLACFASLPSYAPAISRILGSGAHAIFAQNTDARIFNLDHLFSQYSAEVMMEFRLMQRGQLNP